jgi:hypothetical protein
MTDDDCWYGDDHPDAVTLPSHRRARVLLGLALGVIALDRELLRRRVRMLERGRFVELDEREGM